MSKLVDLLREVNMEKNKHLATSLVDMEASEVVQDSCSISCVILKAYKLSVELSFAGYCADKHEVEMLRRKARRALTEEVFGEFRPMIILIERALFDRDFEKANKALLKLEATMFGE